MKNRYLLFALILLILIIGCSRIYRRDTSVKDSPKGITTTAEPAIRDGDSPKGSRVTGWVELPAEYETENTIVVHHMLPDREGRNYSILYDTIHKISYWVAYPLVDWHVGEAGRSSTWTYDPHIERCHQPYLKLSYAQADLDKGHQIPSKDRTYSRKANATTFYFTNSTPQNSTLNQQGWAVLEDRVREWVKLCDTLYVVSGAVLPPADEITYAHDRNGNEIAVPAYYYKALAQRRGEDDFTTAAYKFDNVATPKSIDLDDFKLTVTELESMTGLTFFPQLSSDTKSKIDPGRWLP